MEGVVLCFLSETYHNSCFGFVREEKWAPRRLKYENLSVLIALHQPTKLLSQTQSVSKYDNIASNSTEESSLE